MSTTNLIASMRFLSLATAALVTGPAATYAAMNPPASQRDRPALKGGGPAALQRAACRKSALDPCHAQMRHSANLVHGDLS